MNNKSENQQIKPVSVWKKLRYGFVMFAFLLALLTPPKQAAAGCGCTGCVPGDTASTAALIWLNQSSHLSTVLTSIVNEFAQHQTYILTTFYETLVKPALQMFTMQMTSVALQQLTAIGKFFDAKQQLETQRLYQELQVQAHKDYQPSRDFCYFGTNVRSLAASEQLSKINTLALNARQMGRHMGTLGMAATSLVEDKASRWKTFKTTYCNPRDNNWAPLAANESGLAKVCEVSNADKERANIDIEYTRLIDLPKTLDIAFYESKAEATAAEADVIAMGNNLYGNDVMSRILSGAYLNNFENQKLYMALRSVAAKRNVAENSYNAIVGLKSSGPKSSTKTRDFLGAVMRELGVPEDEVYTIIGENPSYYAQLEILAKKIYQTPNFFAGLYDKPANVERKSVALKAIELMLDRAIYESQLRQEMSMSVLLSTKLESEFSELGASLQGGAE